MIAQKMKDRNAEEQLQAEFLLYDKDVSGSISAAELWYVMTNSGEQVTDKYVGEMKNGQLHGQGTYTWANGDKYIGEYKDGKEHGQGRECIVSTVGSC